ncbi:platelet-derived growth factor subunit A [Homalodisca vitripennis]|uniref:platelet-derived growth factor subunit A n=1 Tax=Homalodisca vitripennis TaxID=197043 RepID=UPI001EEA270C|nr:platelet-derived growth factor subunit A [Homalodisca vitripennis]
MALAYVCLCVILAVTATTGDLNTKKENTCEDCDTEIPLELALRLNTITDENQLFREFVKPPADVEVPIIKVAQTLLGFGPDSVTLHDEVDAPLERKAVSKPQPAGCKPENRSVSLRLSDNPWIYYWPPCTRVEQCGGCCNHHLLSCQPVEVETLNFQVIVTETVNNQLKYKGKEIVTVDRHTKCKCDCKVKKEDCSPLQEYRKGECRCVCTNKDAEAKCNAESLRHWNASSCTCECLDAVECSDGTYLDQSSCSCEPLPDEIVLKRLGYNNPENFTKDFSPRLRGPLYTIG